MQMQLIEHPDEFKQGVRILMLTLRGKDGGKQTGGDRVAKKIITSSVEEFDEALQKLVSQASPNERIYSTVDARDFGKGIRNFKRLQLDADYTSDDSRFGFYKDAFNRVVSSLQQPTARATSLFLWDCDSIEDTRTLIPLLESVPDEEAKFVHGYETKNGWHLITEPFNYPKYIPKELHPLLQKNAMMLWGY